MGQVEQTNRKRTRRNTIKRVILSTVQVSGLLALALLAPNSIRGLAKLGIIPHRRQREMIRRSCDRLVLSGLLVRVNGKLRLTSRGEAHLRQLELKDFTSRKRPKWDGKWRILMFDIPEFRRAIRDKIRRTLALIGFVRLQDSVWIYPYDCEDLITFLKADFRIGRDVIYMISEALEGEAQLRRRFGLKY